MPSLNPGFDAAWDKEKELTRGIPYGVWWARCPEARWFSLVENGSEGGGELGRGRSRSLATPVARQWSLCEGPPRPRARRDQMTRVRPTDKEASQSFPGDWQHN